MGRKKFTFTSISEVLGAKEWLKRQITDHKIDLPDFSFDLFDNQDIELWSHHIEASLLDAEWNRLKITLRAQRARTNPTNKKRNISLNNDAHKILSALAKRDNKTLSDFIIDRFQDDFNAFNAHENEPNKTLNCKCKTAKGKDCKNKAEKEGKCLFHYNKDK